MALCLGDSNGIFLIDDSRMEYCFGVLSVRRVVEKYLFLFFWYYCIFILKDDFSKVVFLEVELK